MIRTPTANYYRAAATVVAAAVLSFTTRNASAQQTVDLFGGTLGTPAMLTVAGTGVATTQSTTGAFGPGYTGTVSLGASALSTLNEGFTSLMAGANPTNAFFISETGVIGAAGATSASRTFTDMLAPGASYSLTLTRTTGFAVGLLGSFNIALSANGTQFLNTSSGQGLVGVVDVLGLFGTNNTATFQFTVPSTATGPLGVTFTSTEPAGALGGTDTFQSASISQVPEPRTVATLLLGASGLVLMRFRRRLRAA